MACMLYIRQNNTERWLGQFKNRAAAEAYFFQWQRTNGRAGTVPIYVETGKGRGKK